MKSSTALIESAFAENHKSLLQMLRHRLGCNHTAEDLMQETYLRVIQQNSVFEINNIRAYLFRIANNLVIDQERQFAASSWGYHDPMDGDFVCPKPSPEKITEAHQELEKLEQHIAQLPPQCRRIFLLHRVQQLSQAEIAEQLGISPRTVETQVGKALKILRNRIHG